MASSNKLIIYQVFTRLYGNRNTTRKEYGTIEENGCGKLNDFTPTTLKHYHDRLFCLWNPPSAPGSCEG